MNTTDKLLTAFVAIGLLMAVSLMGLTVPQMDATPIVVECNLNVEC